MTSSTDYIVIHETEYPACGVPVSLAQHLLHLLPRELPWQLRRSAELRIEPAGKRLVFSDRLDIPRALALYRHFRGRIQTSFGIGTDLSNDTPHEALNIVMKITACNGQSVAKISDAPGKTLCDDETFLAYLRQVFSH